MSAAWIAATFSGRTPASPAVCDTSLPALLTVARSLPNASALAALPLLGGGVAAGAEGLAPKSDFNPSRLLRTSMCFAPCWAYRRLY
jgi:hypothetical protein